MLELVRRYLDALERSDRRVLEEILGDRLEQIEFPNRLMPEGQRRDRAALLDSFERGKKVLRSQRFEIQHAVVNGNDVAFETTWTAELAIPVGSLKAGDTMRARFAVFMRIEDGKIVSQHNYDCFDPF